MVARLKPKFLKKFFLLTEDIKRREEVIEATNAAMFDEGFLTEKQAQSVRSVFSISDRITLHDAVLNTSLVNLEELFTLMHVALVEDAEVLITALSRYGETPSKRAILAAILERNFRNQEMLEALRDACFFSKEMGLKFDKEKLTSSLMALAEEIIESGIILENALDEPLSRFEEARHSKEKESFIQRMF